MNNHNSINSQIIKSIQSVIGVQNSGLHEPSFFGNELGYLKECIDSTFVSSVGKFVDLFESQIAEYTGSKYAIAVVNGTSALHIALKIAGVKEGHEVLVPSLSFIASANAISYCNATPHFIDSEEPTLGVDVTKLSNYLDKNTTQNSGKCINKRTGKVISTIVPMHTFGHPCDMDQLLVMAKKFNITVIEDAAESLGSFYNHKHTGTFGLLGVLSFNGNKTITTGGGGVILTNEPKLARYAKHLTTTAKLNHSWEYRHDEIGFNYRLPNLNAALGCAQLEKLQKILDAKRKLFLLYKNVFENVKGLRLVCEPQKCLSNYWLQTLLLDLDHVDQRDNILNMSNEIGLTTRPAWTLISELEPYINCPSMNLDNAKSLSMRIINIPSSANLILS